MPMADWLETLVRTLGVFLLVLVLARLVGKRANARPTFFERTVGIAVGVIAVAVSLNLTGNLVHGLLVLGVWTLIPLALYWLSLKYKFVHDLIQGKETILINHGKVLDDKLSEVRLTSEDLLGQLRRKNIFSFADVEFAVLEPTGEISALLKKDKQPLTVADSTAVVLDQDVTVAVKVKGFDRLRIKGIKKEVSEGVKGLLKDPCYTVHVTSDKKLYAKLQELAQKGGVVPKEELPKVRAKVDKIIKDMQG